MKIMNNVCRICMDKTGTLVYIFTDVRDLDLNELKVSLSDILAQCTNRPVGRGDQLPQYVCLSCALAAQIAFRFKWKSERSYQHFCHVLNKPCFPENKKERDRHEDQTNCHNDQDKKQKPIQADRHNHQQQKPRTHIKDNHADVPAESCFIPNLHKRPTRSAEKPVQSHKLTPG
ncbi:uncharacterized zinc finger protein CG2678 [Drosophila rhopaloa]|uniref:Uncharacterized zinc finger protein CG2678 n=1 Tax=Drosophila rhopaloa TaxID=1041015 RepID=A0A6P4FI51_DRORH|nr:uncharacterized zinc finger protein CG2678 [Drosophila rhopaloa]